ncbi:MAG TPA: hypothetical protein VIF62_20260 [Labilithrix sp.]|jgi:hypothetical protein
MSTNAVTVDRPLGLPSWEDAVRGVAAAREAVALSRAAASLYEAGGSAVLTSGTQAAIRTAAERAAGNVLGEGATLLARDAGTKLLGGVGATVVRSAGKQILKGAGKAAGIGFAIDGAFAAWDAVRAVRAGEITRRQAIEHVAKEGATGAIATAAGTLACVGLVALTGPLSVPALVVCGAGASLGAKTALRRWVKRVR